MMTSFENFVQLQEVAPFVMVATGFPVIDVAGFAQRVFKILLVSKLLNLLIKFFSTPAYLALLVVSITYFPDTIQWILMQLGLIQIKIFSLMLSVIMPDIFGGGVGETMNSWADIWNNALNALPAELVEVMAKMNIAELMGLVTSTLASGWIINIYRKTMARAGLM